MDLQSTQIENDNYNIHYPYINSYMMFYRDFVIAIHEI